MPAEANSERPGAAADLVAIPDEVHAGDFVLGLAKGVGEKSTITDYVVTEPLAGNFDKALGLIKSAVETGSSRAAYLDGSFGSGKSHFMAVLYAILDGDPDARGKKGLADVVAKHDPGWRAAGSCSCPITCLTPQSLDSAILGGYVAHVIKQHPGKPLPAVYATTATRGRRELRQQLGDEEFIAQLPPPTTRRRMGQQPTGTPPPLTMPSASRLAVTSAAGSSATCSSGPFQRTRARSAPTRSPTSRSTRGCR